VALKEMSEDEANELVEEAMKRGYIDYYRHKNTDSYYYNFCEFVYDKYQIGSCYIFDTELGRFVSADSTAYSSNLEKMFDLWFKI